MRRTTRRLTWSDWFVNRVGVDAAFPTVAEDVCRVLGVYAGHPLTVARNHAAGAVIDNLRMPLRDETADVHVA